MDGVLYLILFVVGIWAVMPFFDKGWWDDERW